MSDPSPNSMCLACSHPYKRHRKHGGRCHSGTTYEHLRDKNGKCVCKKFVPREGKSWRRSTIARHDDGCRGDNLFKP